MFKKIISKLTDVLGMFASLFAIAMFIVVLIGALRYWNSSMISILSFDARMFWIGLIVAIIAGTMYFVEMFIKVFGSCYKDLFSNKKEVQ